MALVTGTATDLLTFARASAGTYVTSAGLVASASSGVIRSSHNPNAADVDIPSQKKRLGFLIEQAIATQDLSFSEALSDASWTKGGLETITTTGTDPTGGSGFNILQPTTASADHRAFKSFTVTSGRPYLFSCYAKANGYSRLMLYANAGITLDPIFNVSAGSVQSVASGAGAIVPMGNGVYRCVAFATATSTLSNNFQIRVCNDAGATTFAGDGSSKILVWGVNLTDATALTSYIARNSASAASRAADSLTVPVSSITSWSSTRGVIEISARSPVGNLGNTVLWQADDGSENNRIRIVRDTSRVLRCIVTTGGAEQCNLSLGTLNDQTDFSVSFAWEADDFAASLDGGAAVTDTGGTIPTVTTIRLGHSFTGEHWNSTLKTMLLRPV